MDGWTRPPSPSVLVASLFLTVALCPPLLSSLSFPPLQPHSCVLAQRRHLHDRVYMSLFPSVAPTHSAAAAVAAAPRLPSFYALPPSLFPTLFVFSFFVFLRPKLLSGPQQHISSTPLPFRSSAAPLPSRPSPSSISLRPPPLFCCARRRLCQCSAAVGPLRRRRPRPRRTAPRVSAFRRPSVCILLALPTVGSR